ncbi:MAG: hypothetical protein ACREC0_00690 [Methylocella sp.]
MAEMTHVPLRGRFFIVGAIALFLMCRLFAIHALLGPLIGAP